MRVDVAWEQAHATAVSSPAALALGDEPPVWSGGAFGTATRLTHRQSSLCAGPVQPPTVFFTFWTVRTCLCVTTVRCCTRAFNDWIPYSRALRGRRACCQRCSLASARQSQPSSGRGRRISRTLHPSHTPRELRLVFELQGALLNPRSWDLDRHVYDLLHSSFRNPLLRNHLDHFNSLWHKDIHGL